jgi:hypothetical protein
MKAVPEGAAFCIALGVMQATGPRIAAIIFCVRADSILLNPMMRDIMSRSVCGSGGDIFQNINVHSANVDG